MSANRLARLHVLLLAENKTPNLASLNLLDANTTN